MNLHAKFSSMQSWAWMIGCLFMAALLSSCGATDREGSPAAVDASAQSVAQAGPKAIDAATSDELLALFTAEPNPIDVSLMLDESNARQREIGPEGGSVETIAANGANYRLAIPAGALIQAITIRMTPVEAAEGLPFDGGVVAGVELEPSGLSLLVPAILSLELPAGVAPEEAWGVSTLAGGEQAALYPVTYSDSLAEMLITGFSGHVVARGGRANAKELEDRPVTSVGRRALGYMVGILREVGSRARQTGEIEFTDDEWLRMEALAALWMANGLEPLRNAAMNDDIQFLRLTYELMVMLRVEALLTAYSASLWLPVELAELWEEPANKAIERAIERCKSEHRFGEIDWIAGLVGRMQQLGLGPDASVVFDARNACGVFRLSFQSTITQQGSSSNSSGELVMLVAGEIPEIVPDSYLVQDNELMMEPSVGAIEYLEARGTAELRSSGSVCRADTVGGIDSIMMAHLADFQIRPQHYGPWSVPEIYGPIEPPEDPQDGVTNILFDPGDPREIIKGDCMGESPTVEGEAWDQIFWINHFDKILEPDDWFALFSMGERPSPDFPEDTGFTFELTQFEGGRRYALQSFEDCDRVTSSDGGSGETCERTFFILYHEPPATPAGGG